MMGVMSLEIATPANDSAAPKRRRRFRFGLRGLIVMVTLAAIVFGILGPLIRPGLRQRAAIEAITELGGVVVLRSPESNIDRFIPLRRGPWHVYFGQYGRRQLVDSDLATATKALNEMGKIRHLSIESALLTDSGVAHLQGVTDFDELDLRCPLVTSRGTDALQQKFPKLLILDD